MRDLVTREIRSQPRSVQGLRRSRRRLQLIHPPRRTYGVLISNVNVLPASRSSAIPSRKADQLSDRDFLWTHFVTMMEYLTVNAICWRIEIQCQMVSRCTRPSHKAALGSKSTV